MRLSEGSDLLEVVEPEGLVTPSTPKKVRRTWPVALALSVLVAMASAVPLTAHVRVAEFDRLEQQWGETQLRSGSRIDFETTLLRSADVAPDPAVSSALVDSYASEIAFTARLDHQLAAELVLDSGLRALRQAIRAAVELHLNELKAVESFYRAPDLPSERPPEASQAFLVQSAEVSRQLDQQRRRLGRPAL